MSGLGYAGRVGLVLGGAGWATIALAQLVAAVVGTDPVALYATGTALAFVGMGIAGVAALRARSWAWPWRAAPLLCALYLLPVAWLFGRDDAVGRLPLAGWMITWLVLGAALLRGRP